MAIKYRLCFCIILLMVSFASNAERKISYAVDPTTYIIHAQLSGYKSCIASSEIKKTISGFFGFNLDLSIQPAHINGIKVATQFKNTDENHVSAINQIAFIYIEARRLSAKTTKLDYCSGKILLSSNLTINQGSQKAEDDFLWKCHETHLKGNSVSDILPHDTNTVELVLFPVFKERSAFQQVQGESPFIIDMMIPGPCFYLASAIDNPLFTEWLPDHCGMFYIKFKHKNSQLSAILDKNPHYLKLAPHPKFQLACRGEGSSWPNLCTFETTVLDSQGKQERLFDSHYKTLTTFMTKTSDDFVKRFRLSTFRDLASAQEDPEFTDSPRCKSKIKAPIFNVKQPLVSICHDQDANIIYAHLLHFSSKKTDEPVKSEPFKLHGTDCRVVIYPYGKRTTGAKAVIEIEKETTEDTFEEAGRLYGIWFRQEPLIASVSTSRPTAFAKCSNSSLASKTIASVTLEKLDSTPGLATFTIRPIQLKTESDAANCLILPAQRRYSYKIPRATIAIAKEGAFDIVTPWFDVSEPEIPPVRVKMVNSKSYLPNQHLNHEFFIEVQDGSVAENHLEWVELSYETKSGEKNLFQLKEHAKLKSSSSELKVKNSTIAANTLLSEAKGDSDVTFNVVICRQDKSQRKQSPTASLSSSLGSLNSSAPFQASKLRLNPASVPASASANLDPKTTDQDNEEDEQL